MKPILESRLTKAKGIGLSTCCMMTAAAATTRLMHTCFSSFAAEAYQMHIPNYRSATKLRSLSSNSIWGNNNASRNTINLHSFPSIAHPMISSSSPNAQKRNRNAFKTQIQMSMDLEPSKPPSSTQSSQTQVQNDQPPMNKHSTVEPGSGPTVVLSPDMTEKEIYASAINRTLQWMAAAAAFGLGLWALFGREMAEEFFAGYIVEQSLSVDNLFVFLLLFDYFRVPLSSQDRVLNWGIYGAIVMRAFMIGVGSVALRNFHSILLVFAGILVYSSVSALSEVVGNGAEDEDEEEDMGQNNIVKFSRNLIDSVDKFDGDRFFTTVDGGIKKATPLFICMIAVEISDVVFAVDSIPAVFGVTENPLIVFTSNMFAIMGLRSLYTVLSKAARDLEYLEPAVAIVLGFIGSKMIAEYFGVLIPTEYSLGVVASLLSGGIGLSVWSKGEKEKEQLQQVEALQASENSTEQ